MSKKWKKNHTEAGSGKCPKIPALEISPPIRVIMAAAPIPVKALMSAPASIKGPVLWYLRPSEIFLVTLAEGSVFPPS